jgi:UDP:flavonoid glycosyltransferase YjiC (YdhE family)
VDRSGLKFAKFDGDFGKEKAQQQASSWNHWNSLRDGRTDDSNIRKARYAALAKRLELNSLGLARLAEGMDLLITPSNCPEGRIAHELSLTPWLSAVFIPQEGLDYREYSDNLFRAAMIPMLQRLGINDPFWTYKNLKRSDPTLFACSKALGQCPEASDDARILQTGFWFYEDPAWSRRKPASDLVRFVEDGDPPLVLSFSSLPLENPRHVLEVHARAAALLKRRLIIQVGWSGFSREDLPVDVDASQFYFADFLPHDWCFPRAAALITHGGVGTLGRALRHSCPILVEPYGNDQFYNALLVKRFGYGAAVHPHRITPETLARAIEEKVLNPVTRDRVSQAAQVIQKENGIDLACSLIESRLNVSEAVG